MQLNENIKITVGGVEIPLEHIDDTNIEIVYGEQKTFIEACTKNGKCGNNFYSAYRDDILVGEFEVKPNSKADTYFKNAYNNHTSVEIRMGYNNAE